MKKINNKRVGQTAGACTDSRPRAQCYQLGRLPLVGSSAFFLNAIVLSLSHGEVPSHRRSAFPSISQELTRNANRKSGTPVTVNSQTVKCPMVRPQWYRLLLLSPMYEKGRRQPGSSRSAPFRTTVVVKFQADTLTNRTIVCGPCRV